jgi:predicted transcriptional regulator
MDRGRQADRPPDLSESELAVLKTLWDVGAGTVREVNAELSRRGRRWAYTTVQTLLTRLEHKGCVESIKETVAYTFQPTVSRDQLLQRRLSDLEAELCEGATSSLVHALVSSKRFTAEDIAHFRRLLDEQEVDDAVRKRSTKPGSKKPRR